MSVTTLSRRHSPRQNQAFANIALWTMQGWLTMFFVAAGYAKLTEPMANLVVLMGWPAYVSDMVVRGVGGVELVLGLALLTPLFSWRIGRPVVLAAAGVIAAMTTAMIGVHAVGADWGLAIINVVLLLLAGAVVYGRSQISGTQSQN